MPEVRPADRITETRSLPANGPPPDRVPTTVGDDWLCLSWLDRSEQPAMRESGGSRPKLAGYEILRELGRKGMGIIYLARDLKLKRYVAIKLMREGLVDATAADRIRAEAEAVGRLQHRNIVQIHEIGEYQGRLYLVSEYVDGPNLHQLLDGKPLPPRWAAELLEPVARAVHHAHEHGILHRELKPANILLSAETADNDQISDLPISRSEYRIPKITDFGLAKWLEAGGDLTQTGSAIGLPNYMAPEQTETSQQVGPKADVYSLGATFYEMLAGRPPFNAADPAETLLQVRHSEPVSPRQLQPGVPRDLETICLKCLRKEQRNRYANAGELADDLRRFLEGRRIKARPVSSITRVVRSARRNPAVTGLVAVLLAGVFALAVGVAMLAAANRRERENKRLAEENLDRAQQAVDDLLIQVATNPQLRKEGLSDLRRDLLARAIPHYLALAKQSDGNPAREAARGRAYAKLALVHGELGELKPAADDYRSACEVFESLMARFPNQAEYQRELASASLRRGKVLVQTARRDEAKREFSRAKELFEYLTRDANSTAEDRLHLAECYRELALLGSQTKVGSEVDELLRIAIDQGQSLISKPPESTKGRQFLAQTRNDYGQRLLRLGKREEAGVQFQKALGEAGELVKSVPGEPDIRLLHARSLCSQGDFLRLTDRRKDAEKIFRQAEFDLTTLAKQFPSIPDYRMELAQCHFTLASMFADASNWPAAESTINEALDIQQRLTAECPASVQYAIGYASSCGMLGYFHFQRGRNDEAMIWLNRCVEKADEILKQDAQSDAARECLWQNLTCRAETQIRVAQYQLAARDWDRTLAVQEPGANLELLRRESTMAWALAGDTDWALEPIGGLEALSAARELIHRSVENHPKWDITAKERERFCAAAVALLKAGYERGKIKYDDELRKVLNGDEFKPIRTRPDFMAFMKSMASKP